MAEDDTPTSDAIAALTESHGLRIDPGSLRLNEAGLDFRVAYATATDGATWVLRLPRREDMAGAIEREAAVLALVRQHLDVAVPDSQVAAPDLVAYPLLPGSPALTLGETGHPVFHVDVDSRRYAVGIGRLMATLHAIPAEEAQAAGLEVPDIGAVRAARRSEYEHVAAEFTVADHLRTRWEAWLDDGPGWPAWTVFSHGELYQAHVLVDAEETITGVLDWTTGGFGDPARDLMFQHMTASPALFELTLQSYREAGGRTWSGVAGQCAELDAFSPVGYGVYALSTGNPEHRAVAQSLLDPPT